MSNRTHIWVIVKKVYFVFAASVLALVLLAGLTSGHILEDGWPWFLMIVSMVLYERMRSA